jgi:fission 1 protein
MGMTKAAQKQIREEFDRKLGMSQPNRQLLEELAIACGKDPTNSDALFQYSFAMSRSTERSELRYAVTILDGLVKQGYEHQLDCAYGAATALYLLGDYAEARVSD